METVTQSLRALAAAQDRFHDFTSSDNNVIPVMAWEQQLQAVLDLSMDQQRFVLSLFASVLVGLGMRGLRMPLLRHLYALVTGVLLTYYPFGAGVVHALPPIIVTYLAMRLVPRSCGKVAWLVNFLYLIYLHVINASGEGWMRGEMDFTGCEMILVLKLISVAVAYQDAQTKKKEEMSDFQAAHAVYRVPTLFEYLSYTFCMGNLLAGPYIEFSDFEDFIELKGVWDPAKLHKAPPSMTMPFVRCLGQAMLFLVVYVRLIATFNVKTFTEGWYLSAPLVQKCGILYVCGVTNQLKYAFSWKLSELSCVLAGLDFDGWDAKTDKPKWGRTRSVQFFRLQACDTARMVTFYWNIRTGNFLRRYVYERLVAKGKKPGFVQLFATQMVSAIWHGLYAGYLLFFAGTAIWIFFSTQLYKIEEKYFPSIAHALPWKMLKIVWTQFVLCYMASAFMVLAFKGSMDVYASVDYFPHIVMLVGCLVLPFFAGGRKKQPSKAEKAASDKAQ